MNRSPGAKGETAAGRAHRYVVACEHVATRDRPTLVVLRTDIAFVFSCGWDAHPPGVRVSWPLVFTDDLVLEDRSLENIRTMCVGHSLERHSLGEPWQPGRLID